MILAGDIGGTKTNLAYFNPKSGALDLASMASYPSRQHSSLRDIIEKYIRDNRGDITAAAFGIAGPVIDGRCEATNLPWVVDSREIASVLGLHSTELVNDLEATAYGALHLEQHDMVLLNSAAAKPRGMKAIIAAGTGLGEGGLLWDGRRYRAVSSEGGHSDFAPRNELEINLLRFMLQRYERVSYERVVSGPGIYAIYQFFRSRAGYPEPDWLRKAIEEGDPTIAVSNAGAAGKDEACVETIETFVSLYGAEAGNLALKLLATGGVYVGGGIAPKILRAIQRGSFMKSFTHKGRFASLLQNIPVHVILNDKAALIGAAHVAKVKNG